MFHITVQTIFSTALRLFQPDLSDEENYALYGPCANPNGHGHNYTLEVTVAGDLDMKSGLVTNFYDLSKMVEELVFNQVDHKNLNTDVSFLKGLVPTSEMLAYKFWEILNPQIKGGKLHKITISERGQNSVSYFGPGQVPVE